MPWKQSQLYSLFSQSSTPLIRFFFFRHHSDLRLGYLAEGTFIVLQQVIRYLISCFSIQLTKRLRKISGALQHFRGGNIKLLQ